MVRKSLFALLLLGVLIIPDFSYADQDTQYQQNLCIDQTGVAGLTGYDCSTFNITTQGLGVNFGAFLAPCLGLGCPLTDTYSVEVFDDVDQSCNSIRNVTFRYVFMSNSDMFNGCPTIFAVSRDYRLVMSDDRAGQVIHTIVVNYDGIVSRYPYYSVIDATSTDNSVHYKDWLFINLIIAFCLSFLAYGALGSPFKRLGKKY